MELLSYPKEVREYLRSGVKKAVAVRTERPHSVIVKFENNVTKAYDMEPDLYGVLEFLKDYAAFEKAYIDETNSIAWDDPHGNHIDTSADTVYIYGKSV